MFAKSYQERTKQGNYFFFSFDTVATYEHILLHIVKLYINTTCMPCLPLSPCTDNDCMWSHSFIFYIIVGASFCFWDCLLICAVILKRFDGVCHSVISVQECVCTVAYWMCVREKRKWDWVCCSVARCSAPNAHQPFACVHHCASVFRCSLASTSVHPNGREGERTGTGGGGGLFPQGKKHTWEKILLKKGYFSPLRGLKKSVNF